MADVITNVLIFCVVCISLFLIYIFLVLYYTSIKPPKANPKRFLKLRSKKSENFNKKRILVACIGDSITHGVYGVNYIKILYERLKNSEYHYEFINAGINGDLTVNILERLDEIIQCEPDIAILLVGTNDVNGSQGERAKIYEITKKIPKDPSFWTENRFKEDYSKIISKLNEETNAIIAISSLPPIGEEPQTKAFNDSKQYSGIIKNLSTEFNVNYLPLNETMIAQLDENAHTPKFTYEKSNPMTMMKFIILHYLGRSWEKISEKNGLQFLTDNLHLNKYGATVIVDLVEKFLNQHYQNE